MCAGAPICRWVLLACLTPALTPGNALARHAPEGPGSVQYDLKADERAVARTANIVGPGFRRTESRHFVILTDCSTASARARAGLLERTRDQFLKMAAKLDLSIKPHDHKLLCVYFNDPVEYAAFAGAHDGLEADWVAGYYATATNRVVFYNDENAPDLKEALDQLESYEAEAGSRRSMATEAARRQDRIAADRLDAAAQRLEDQIASERSRLTRHTRDVAIAKTIHEAVHLLAFNTGLQDPAADYPFWLSEGLATSFETTTPSAAFGPAYESPSRQARLAELAAADMLPPLDDLVTFSTAPADDAEAADAMYHFSYALFAHLYRFEREKLGAYIESFKHEPPGPISPARQRELFRNHFGDPRPIERRILVTLDAS